MSLEDTAAPADHSQEVSALVDTLQKTGRRLEELTGGQVDTVLDRDGRVLFLRGTQEQLKQSETAKQAAILNALPSYIALLDPDGVIIVVNDSWRDFAHSNALQLSPGHGLGTNYLKICEMASGEHASQSHRAAEGIRSLLTGASKSFSMEYVCHSGAEQSWFLLSPILLDDGRGNNVIIRQFDITSQKQAEAGLRSLAERLSLATAVAGVGVWEWELSSNTLTWDTTMFAIYGLTPTVQVPYKTWAATVHPDDLETREAALLRVIKDKSDGASEFRITLADGSGKLISATEKAVLDLHGKVLRVVGVNMDITERTAMQRQLQMSQKMDAVGQLTGGIAHDFNNLLSIIIGNLDLLEQQVSGDADALQRTQTAQKAALRGADLTRRLLTFSSNETLSPKSTNLHHLIRNMVEMTSRIIGPEIKIVTHFDDSISKIFVDAAGLEHVLVNLLVNARDAMPSGGTITITSRPCNLEESYPPVKTGELKAGRYACIDVSDSGHGMSRQTLERVFEPFFTTKPRGKGTGLGLAMVYGFMKQSHGTVRIYSEPGYGTTFTLYLPLAENDALPVEEVIESKKSLIENTTVLVVDDEPDLLDVATAYLEDMGCKVYTAVNGNDALQVIELNGNIDLMITDIVMAGGLNGVELAQKVRQINPRIKIIYCSGFSADTLAENGISLTDGALLHKPYRRDDLNAMARHAMETEDDVAPKK